MRSSFRRPGPRAGSLVVAATLALLDPAAAVAHDAPLAQPPACTCPAAPDPGSAAPDPTAPQPRPKFAEIRPLLDVRDEAAALEAVTVALTEVADGSTYIWYRHGGRLTGAVQPTQSFKDGLGRVCRQIVVTLNDASRTRRTEAIACRLADGGWQLEG